ncbi:MAG TPA: class I SAM-dependent methyltransferase [Caldimonas sp.]|jgi:SAM-dependent methyltransferase|nr:class I SAM-dependent methyltransferase [Caldimonas sp.]HEX2542875.1 class I SAM-dependent methyltransferase [Caldimonas sp.]
MNQPTIRFDDGAAYEEFMGVWSRLAGEEFLRWLAPPPGWRWADVGCGNGAFTELLFDRCAPFEVEGIDPSEGQLDFARTRLADRPARFVLGDATALPWADDRFDAAVMALVIFFVPDPAKGIQEMARVVKPGGSVSSYSWDILGGGFPYTVLQEEMAHFGTPPLWPPSSQASRMEVLRTLWADAGLVDLRTREITVQRTFADFEAFWRIAQTGPRLAPRFATMPVDELALLKQRVQARFPADADGRITYAAFANAIEGRVPR